MTPLLTRIQQAFDASTDPAERAELLAERACYLARIGQLAEAQEIAASLRRTYGDGRNARVSVWIMLAEGLVLFFGSLDIRSRDRLLRSRALSAAFRHSDLVNLTSAWLAHVEFNRCDYLAMTNSLSFCNADVIAVPGAWQLRACLVLANANLCCRREGVARIWYERARQMAVQLGDEASIGAIIYNKAALGLSHLRFLSLTDSLTAEAIKFQALEIESANNYNDGVGNRALGQLLIASKARMLAIQGKHQESLQLMLQFSHERRPNLNIGSEWILVDLERAECLFRCGYVEDARALFDKVGLTEISLLSLDDQFLFLGFYVRLGAELQSSAQMSPHRDLRDRLRQQRLAQIEELRLLLSAWDANIPASKSV